MKNKKNVKQEEILLEMAKKNLKRSESELNQMK